MGDELTLEDVAKLLGERDLMIYRLQRYIAQLEADLKALKGA